MRTKTIATLPLLASAAALLLSACDASVRVDGDSVSVGSGQLKTLARLDCPEREDQLRLVSAAPDGMSCNYAGEESEVQMRLVPVNGGSPEAMLAAYETELRAMLPARTPAEAPQRALNTDTDVAVGVEAKGDEAHIRLPGMSIDTSGDQAQVRIGDSVVIDANEAGANVNVTSDDGKMLINADESGAEIRRISDERGDIRRHFFLASEAPSAEGWSAVGYEVRGPAAGPLVVATIKTRENVDGNHDGAVDAMQDLVRKTVGR